MNEKLIVVLLLITIVLSITSMAIVFNMSTDVNIIREVVVSQPSNSASVSLEVLPSGTGGAG